MPKYLDGAGLLRFWDNIKGRIGNASQEQVDAWLDNHPEATTTVQDGAVTTAKLADGAVTDTKLAQTGGVLDDVEYLRKLITNIDEWEVLSGKYASFSGTTVNLYNIANIGCIRIPVSDYVGDYIEVNTKSLNTTYNLCYAFADENSGYINGLKTSGVTNYENVIALVPTNAAYMYINFDYTSGFVNASAERLEIDRPFYGTLQSSYPIITLDQVAKTLTISNVVAGSNIPVYLTYWNSYSTVATNSTALSQSFSNVNNGALLYDLINKTFVFRTSWAMTDRERYVVIAMFVSGTATSTSKIITIANEDKHAKKSLLCYGDSLTWYDGNAATWGPDQGTTIVGFESYLRAYLHMSVGNAGRSGETIPQICARMATDSSARSCDMLMLMGGDNDDRQGVTIGTLLPQGSTFDTTTTIGAMQNAIESVLTDNPTCVLFLATEPMGWKWNGTALERVDDVYPNAIRRVAEHYGLPLLDLWKISGVNEMTRNTMYLDPPDTTNQQYMYHPNNYGWKVISERIIQFIQTL